MPKDSDSKTLNFDVSTGLKRVLGRELITDDEVAIFELVKNSFDAEAGTVHLYFGDGSVIVADDGSGMSYEDLTDKWLFVAYSAKREDGEAKDFRDIAAERRNFAGSKGIGRFSTDRLGQQVVLQTRPKPGRKGVVHRLVVDWQRFDKNDKEHFEKVPVTYSATDGFEFPAELKKFGAQLTHGTIIEIKKLRRRWDRTRILDLKSSLAKLINPFEDKADRFRIIITVPAEDAADKQVRADATKKGEEPLTREIVNGQVGNFIFSALREKTTFISVSIEKGSINTTLSDRGELIYKIREPNPYKHLDRSGFACEIYYLNQSAKVTFARRVGLPSVQFGSVFLFRNGFRVYPVGEANDDWFGFDRRKQQGYNRFLGTREIIGRVDVYGSDEDFQEASSRNQGLIVTSEFQTIKSLPTRYRYSFTNWQQFAAGNQYGNTNPWFSGITSGNSNAIQTGFRNLLPAIQPVDVTATPQAQQDWRQQYGLIQLQDASLMSGMKAIGDIRANIQNNATALAQLEADATSTDPTLQSEKALQQKTLVAMLMMIHTLQDANRALTSSVDIEIQALAQQRWERGRELNAAAKDRQGH
jgi:hypothetical protein